MTQAPSSGSSSHAKSAPPPRLPRLAAAAVALILPPLGVGLRRGRGRALILSAALSLIGLAIFFLLAAGPGLLIWLLAILHALLATLLTTPRSS